MKLININEIPKEPRPGHHRYYAQEIWGPGTGYRKVVVQRSALSPDGWADMDVHKESDHIFVVLEGEFEVSDGTNSFVVGAGQALVVEAGEPHRISGRGDRECVYIIITCPPVVRSA